jgi:hypothetical protein
LGHGDYVILTRLAAGPAFFSPCHFSLSSGSDKKLEKREEQTKLPALFPSHHIITGCTLPCVARNRTIKTDPYPADCNLAVRLYADRASCIAPVRVPSPIPSPTHPF